MESTQCAALVIHAPEIFEDPAFVVWLNDGWPKLTRPRLGGSPSEWAGLGLGGMASEVVEVLVRVGPGIAQSGSSQMPLHIESLIVAEVQRVLPSEIWSGRVTGPSLMVLLTCLPQS